MKLVIGGYSQGKLNYVLEHYKLENYVLLDGERLANTYFVAYEEVIVVVNALHKFVKTALKNGDNPEEYMASFVEEHPNCIIICDEIGNGIVPIDAFEREYRERTGRLLIELAKKAESVERVICGIGQKIK